MYTLSQRLSRASALRAEGHNCAQTVAMVFDDIVPLPAEALAMATAALGGGIGGTGSVCGCVSAIAMVSGAASYSCPADKKAVYARAARLKGQFEEQNMGQSLCADLRKPGRKTCGQLIEEAITILHNELTPSV